MQDPDEETEVSGAIELVRDFVNTREPQVGTDELSSPAALRDWSAARALVPADAAMDVSDLAQALAVREGLRAVLLGHGGHESEDPALDLLNQVLEEATVTVRFDASGYRFVPRAPGALAHVLAALCDAIRQSSEDRTWERLKVCARDTCRWAYFDSSRNKARRWCSMAGCGNHVKMKRAYARRTQAG